MISGLRTFFIPFVWAQEILGLREVQFHQSLPGRDTCGEEIPCRSQFREPDNIHKEIRDHSSRALPRTCDLSGRTAAEGEIPFGPPRR